MTTPRVPQAACRFSCTRTFSNKSLIADQMVGYVAHGKPSCLLTAQPNVDEQSTSPVQSTVASVAACLLGSFGLPSRCACTHGQTASIKKASTLCFTGWKLEASAGVEPAMADLQSAALATWPRRRRGAVLFRFDLNGQAVWVN